MRQLYIKVQITIAKQDLHDRLYLLIDVANPKVIYEDNEKFICKKNGARLILNLEKPNEQIITTDLYSDGKGELYVIAKHITQDYEVTWRD